MLRQQFNLLSFLEVILLSTFFCSCLSNKQNKYVDQLKDQLHIYDSVNSTLIAKYSNYSLGNNTIIYPSEKASYGDGFRVFDSSLKRFCKQNDINYIQIQSTSSSVVYFLSDNNYQYIYDSNGTGDKEIFENTRVRVVPVNDNWRFQYEKPNF